MSAVLVVDLDGTLLRTDAAWETLLELVRCRPWRLLLLPLWLLRGRSYAKLRLAQEASLDVRSLPYDEELLQWLKLERQRGRRLILATAAAAPIAHAVAEHLRIFDAVLCSNSEQNVRGTQKLQALRALLQGQPFEYVGNSPVDGPLWRAAARAHVVGPRWLARWVQQRASLGRHFHRTVRLRDMVALLRVHQWVKNVLVFVPLVLAHRMELSLWGQAAAAALALSLWASALYVWNDLLDLPADRAHPRKRQRPIASGRIPIWLALSVIPFLLGGGWGIALHLPEGFQLALLGYGAGSAAYSLWLKRLALVDVLMLSSLYTLRVLAGGWATGVPLSGWLLTFSVFLFVSLGFLKRYVELHTMQPDERRGYRRGDERLLYSFGSASGYLAVLVLLLYLNSPDVLRLYSHPRWLWLSSPLLLYWIAYLWLRAHRREMSDDPVVFVLRDRISYAIAAAIVVVLLLAL